MFKASASLSSTFLRPSTIESDTIIILEPFMDFMTSLDPALYLFNDIASLANFSILITIFFSHAHVQVDHTCTDWHSSSNDYVFRHPFPGFDLTFKSGPRYCRD